MSRFNEATLEVYNLDYIVAMIAMKCSLQQCLFLFFLEKRPAIVFSEILAKTEKYTCTEEANGA